jgi:hypothetical protein
MPWHAMLCYALLGAAIELTVTREAAEEIIEHV